MKELDKYRIRRNFNPWPNYLFDKLTGLFIKHETNSIIENPGKILFVRNDHIGDMVYSTQVFRETKKIFPKTKISVIATRGNRTIIEKDKNVDKIIEIDLFWRRGIKGFLDYFKVLKELKKERYDMGIDLRASKLNIFFFLFMPRIKNRIAYYNVTGGKAFLTHPVFYEKQVNVVYEYLNLINKALNVNRTNYMPEISTSKEDEQEVNELLVKNKKQKYFVISPGATVNSKKWPEENFSELVNRLHKKYPKHKIVMSGANSDKELLERLCNNKKYCIPLVNFNLRKMAVVLRGADAIVANNGAATDIGWVSGGKLVYLAGPVNLITDKPLKNTITLHHELPCYPCNWSKPCKKPHGQWCMELITVDEVMNAVDKFMKK